MLNIIPLSQPNHEFKREGYSSNSISRFKEPQDKDREKQRKQEKI